jgi:hypothetical protein
MLWQRSGGVLLYEPNPPWKPHRGLHKIAIGFAINWLANMWILPLYGFHITRWPVIQHGPDFYVDQRGAQLRNTPLV